MNRILESFSDWLNEEYPGHDCSVAEDEFGNEYFVDQQVSMMFACYIAAYRHSRIDAAHGFNLFDSIKLNQKDALNQEKRVEPDGTTP